MRKRIALSALAAILLAAWVSSAQQEKLSAAPKHQKDALVYAELAQAPEKARAKQNPFEKDSEAVAAGRNLFQQHCAECHGESAEGGRKGPSLRAREIQEAPPGSIFWILTNGVVRRGMPVWSKLPEPQRWQIVSFIKSLGVSASVDLPPGSQAVEPNAPLSARRQRR